MCKFHPDRPIHSKGMCKACAHKDWILRNPEQAYSIAKRKSLKFHYKLSLEEYNAQLERQGRVCFLCRRPNAGRAKEKGLYVDHDHKTGKFRGLLCSTCNLGLGYFQDNPVLLRLAAEYLEARQ